MFSGYWYRQLELSRSLVCQRTEEDLDLVGIQTVWYRFTYVTVAITYFPAGWGWLATPCSVFRLDYVCAAVVQLAYLWDSRNKKNIKSNPIKI
jgi:hypothetical protein